MISGATLLDYRKRYDTKTFVKKRVTKTVIPFLIWSCIWCIARAADGQYKAEDITFKFFFDGFFNTAFSPTYWFFIPLFTVYACIIVLSLVPEENRKRIYGGLIVAGFATLSVLPFILGFLGVSLNAGLMLPLSGGGYLMFVLFGYYIDKYEVKPAFRIPLYFLGVAGLLVHLLGTQFASFANGYIVSAYKGYLNVPSALYAAAIFTAFKDVKKGGIFQKLYKACKTISPVTFGVYLIHGLLLDFFIRKLPFDSCHILFRIFGAVGIFALSGGIVWILQRIPVVKKIVP